MNPQPTPPIIHCSIQCSNCGKWFWDRDCLSDEIHDSYDLSYMNFECPICKNSINVNICKYKCELNIEDSNYEEMKKDCMTRKEVWE